MSNEVIADEVVHPRPQLVRPGWVDLSGTWQFSYDNADVGLGERWYDSEDAFGREIQVPYPPESELSGVHETGYHPVVWYRRTFDQPELPENGRLLLHFGAVDYRASVWVNGAYVDGHEGGHSSFGFDVTAQLAAGQSAQVVVVRAEDQPTDVTQPRGKQDWLPEPHVIWYHRTTGIWQPVWLEAVPAAHIAELAWVPDLAAGSVTLHARVTKSPATAVALRVRVRLGDEVLAESTVRSVDADIKHTIALSAATNGQDTWRLTWMPESPTLLDVDVTLLDVTLIDGALGGEDQVLDEVTSYFGLRSCGYSDGRFLLNDRPYFLRLVLGQNYWPQSHLAAPSADALRREVELIKELGFNGVRVHQKVEDPRFLYWCDRLGLMVWGEMANSYAYSVTAVERLTREWLEVVRRDSSHPCIVTWVPMNESWGISGIEHDPAQQHFATALFHLTKALDPTRPVISNDGWEHTDSDIWGIHDYAPTGDLLTERYGSAEAIKRSLHEGRPGGRRVLLLDGTDRGQPVMLTEFGGLSYAPDTGEKWFGYSTVKSSDDLLRAFRELVEALLNSPDVAGFCYTQLTDTEQETNGLLTAGRQPKIPTEQVREVLSLPAKAIPPEEVDYRRRQAEAASQASPTSDASAPC